MRAEWLKLRRSKLVVLFALLVSFPRPALSQTAELHGQASGWLTANPGTSPEFQSGVRYLPDLLLKQELGGGLDANIELSLNTYAIARFGSGGSPSYDWNARMYRAWGRLSSDRFEMRAGLQKINFGSALLFRPLMWFDRVDARDPLQLTDGVYGVLLRYYFPDNTNVWLWGLLGNAGTKGWELVPTESKTVEYGGRAQSPLWSGEIGLTYHHRRADLGALAPVPAGRGGAVAPEDRFGIDGKWDVGIGLWCEAVLIRQASVAFPSQYQRQWTVGADYTFGVGNGLYAAAEYFRSDNTEEAFGSGTGRGFSALSLSYPVAIVDQVSAIVYRDWSRGDWYRILTWQRTFDNWNLYLLGFWNPVGIFIGPGQAGNNSFAGKGVEFMVMFNH